MNRLFVGFFCAILASTASGQGFAQAATPSFKRVLLIVLENTNYDVALRQPFMGQLARQGVNFTQFYAETHPSQGNYIAMIAGDTLGVTGDGRYDLAGDHLGDLLERTGKTWKTYAEGYPGNCFLGTSRGKYARKHVPFLSFTNVQNNPSRCANIVPSEQFENDLASNSLPHFTLYVPDLDNDGHDTSPAKADQALSLKLRPIITNPGILKDMLVVVTFDESEQHAEQNHIYTVMLGANTVRGATVNDKVNHYNILKLIEDNFGLGNLGRKDATATPIQGVWQ